MTNDERLERLAVYTGIRKQLEADEKKLRNEAMQELEDKWVPMVVNGETVGKARATYKHEATELVCDDPISLLEWFNDNPNHWQEVIEKKGKAVLDVIASALITDGEIPSGCRTVHVPGRKSGIVVKDCEPDAVAYALGMNIPQAVIYLLNEGSEI